MLRQSGATVALPRWRALFPASLRRGAHGPATTAPPPSPPSPPPPPPPPPTTLLALGQSLPEQARYEPGQTFVHRKYGTHGDDDLRAQRTSGSSGFIERIQGSLSRRAECSWKRAFGQGNCGTSIRTRIGRGFERGLDVDGGGAQSGADAGRRALLLGSARRGRAVWNGRLPRHGLHELDGVGV